MYGSALHVPPRWDRWFATFSQEYRNFLMNDQGHIRHFGKTDLDYADKVFNRTGLDWIDRQQMPYFAFLSILAPHTPYEKPPGYTQLFKGASPPSFKQPNFNEKDVSDKPQYIQVLPRFTSSDIAGIKERYQHRLQQMRLDDDALGVLVDHLARAHQLDNTYIVVSSDNGWMQGEHRFSFGKSVPYEEDVNLPLFVRGPGIAPGTHISQLASMIDLYPTFLDIAGTHADRDGRSLLPLLHGEPVTWRKQLLIENFSLDEDRVPHFFGVISDRYKYVEYASGDKEFYDLKKDPYEMKNEIGTVSDSFIAAWKTKLDALSICAGASCRQADAK
jgi:N-acetylglucosamine-6-sulfatase